MEHEWNYLGQPIGRSLADWRVPPVPDRKEMEGRYCRLEPLDAGRHAGDLFAANAQDEEGRCWTYLPYGPFETLAEYTAWVEGAARSVDPLFFAIVDKDRGHATGVASYLRIQPESGSIEVGHLNYSPLLQGTRAATEAMFMMMERAFVLGYRRYEWKCNALNAASRTAALRLGMSFEGVFRQATVVKGRSRDTAWYAAIDLDWPALEGAFRQWLDPANFDEEGRQRTRLSALTAPILGRP
jgi:RimJ/RimL family protein N-acetyltransferase